MTSSIQEYLVLLHSPEKEKRAFAAGKLGALGSAGVEAVSSGLRDADWHLRYRAAEVIGFSREAAGVPLLIPLLSDEKDHVRYMAVKSLGFCGTKELVPVITPMLEDENPFVRRIAGNVLSGWNI